MLNKIFGAKKTGYVNGLSDFMKNASSRKKKKVYMGVIKDATEAQRKIVNS